MRGSAGSAATTGSIAHQIATVLPGQRSVVRMRQPAGARHSSAITSAAERGGPLGSTRALATGAEVWRLAPGPVVVASPESPHGLMTRTATRLSATATQRAVNGDAPPTLTSAGSDPRSVT